MTVKIEMEMPKSCEVCVLKRFSSSDQKSMFCGADNDYHRIYKTKRPKDCPLQEVKE